MVANQFHPDYATSPGATLVEILSERSMRQGDLAKRTGLARKTINEIIAGKAPLTPETAQKFELVFGTPARFWNERERLYRQHLAQHAQDKKLSHHLGWEKNFPYGELVKRGKLNASTNPLRKIRNLCRFFAIAEPASIENVFADLAIAGTLFRRGSRAESKPYLVWTWLRLAQLEAGQADTPKFQKAGFARAAGAIARRTAGIVDPAGFSRFWHETRDACMAAGVALVLVPEFKGAAINGAAFWQSDTPVIALTLRGKRLDGFVFTLLHEAAHILLHRRNLSFMDVEYVITGGVDRAAVEKDADEFATQHFVPPQFDEKIRTATTLEEIEALATDAGVHRDLIIGRYGRLTNVYARFAAHKLQLSWDEFS